MTPTPFFMTALACTLALAALAVSAHEGHDHADGPANAAASTTPVGAPRLVATSPDFELVGTLEGRRLTLWLDRAESNVPVTRGSLVLEMGELRLPARADGEVWRTELPVDPAPGTVAVTAAIEAEGVSDRLAGELVSLPREKATTVARAAWFGRTGWLALGGAALLLLALLVWRFRFQARSRT